MEIAREAKYRMVVGVAGQQTCYTSPLRLVGTEIKGYHSYSAFKTVQDSQKWPVAKTMEVIKESPNHFFVVPFTRSYPRKVGFGKDRL